jgi:hypothetical protein
MQSLVGSLAGKALARLPNILNLFKKFFDFESSPGRQ